MVYLFLADGFEEVEALTPLDYLRRVDEHNIATVGVYDTEVTGSHGLTSRPTCTWMKSALTTSK